MSNASDARSKEFVLRRQEYQEKWRPRKAQCRRNHFDDDMLPTTPCVNVLRAGCRVVSVGKSSPHGSGSLFVSPHGSLAKLKAYNILY